MIVRLLSFKARMTEAVARKMRTVDEWHSACSQEPTPLPVEGVIQLGDDNDHLRILFIIGESGAVELELDAESAKLLLEGLDAAVTHMQQKELSDFVDNLDADDVKEMTDIIGGILSNRTAAES